MSAAALTRDPVVTHTRALKLPGLLGCLKAWPDRRATRPEVYVQSFPEGRSRTQVSIAGGTQIRWSGDGREILYVALDGKMMAVPLVLAGTSLDVMPPVPLFQTHLATGTNVLGYKPQYAVSRDGRFLLNTAIESASAPIVVSVNWMKTIRR
jgi:hypothetical protein